MDLEVQIRATVDDDRSWMADDEGDERMRGIQLNGALFVAIYTDGRVPSGTPIGKITSTGLYAPYDDSLSNGQEVCAGFIGRSTQCIARPTFVTHNVVSQLFWTGAVIEAKLPTGWSGLGSTPKANAKADLASWIKFF